MIITEATSPTSRTAGDVWSTWTDVERWSAWNPGVREASIDGVFKLGATGWVRPRGGPKSDYTIIGCELNRSWVLRSRLAGARIVFSHEYLAEPEPHVKHRVHIEGPLARLWAALFRRGLTGDVRHAVDNLAGSTTEAPGATG